jgi:hypothetical protein
VTANNIIQLGVVCRAEGFEDTMRYWQESAGSGPCWVIDAHPEKQTWYGEPADAKMRTAFTYVGDLQVEIISPRNDTPNPATAALAENPNPPRAGIAHHIQFEAQDYEATVAELVAGGSVVAWTAEFRGRQLSYLETKDTFGFPFVEVAGPRTPEALAMAAAMKLQTKDWDGKTDPVRSYVDLLQSVTAAQ